MIRCTYSLEFRVPKIKILSLLLYALILHSLDGESRIARGPRRDLEISKRECVSVHVQKLCSREFLVSNVT